MEKISKRLFTSKILDLGGANRHRSKRGRTPSKFFQKIDTLKISGWLKLIIILAIPMIILTPEIRITTPAIRLEEILLFFSAFLYLALLLKRRVVKVTVVDYIFGALFISTLASIIFSYIGIGYKFYLNDFFEFLKLAKYYLIYRIIYDLDWDKEDFGHILATFILSSVLAILFGMMQYFNLFNINSMMTLFTKPVHVRAINVAGRIVGTLKNANAWALFLGGTIFLVLADLVRSLEHKVSKKHFVVLGLLFFSLLAIIMTLSRTSIIAIFIALAVICFAIWHFSLRATGKLKTAKEIFIILSIFITFSMLAFYSLEILPGNFNKLNLTERFEAGLQEIGLVEEGTIEGDFNSWNSRSKKWKNSIALTLKSPIFGYGPSKSDEAKENVPYATDNEYILYFYRYGLLGLTLYLGFFGFWAFSAFVNVKKTIKKLDSAFMINIIALGFAVSFPLYNLLAGTFYDFQLFPLFMMFETLNLLLMQEIE